MIVQDVSRESAVPAPPARVRLHHLDYLRAGVVALVFLHHTAITYGGSGSWYYADPHTSTLAQGLLTIFCAYNQSWFMGLLFLLSGFLSIPSYHRKGARRYVRDRLVRFGIPLVAYALVVSPVTVWLAQGPGLGHLSLVGVYVHQRPFDFGVLWFVEALLIMDLLFVLWARRLTGAALTARVETPFPGGRTLLAFIVVVGLVSYAVRLAMPLGTTFAGLNLGYFPSYIAMFALGLVAWRRGWLEAIPDPAFRFARRAAIGGAVALPFLLAIGVQAPGGAAAFTGGLHWQALALAVWEQVMLVGVSIVLLRWGQRRLNRPSPRWQGWASASYLAYAIQPPFIVAAALVLQGATWPPLAKFIVVGPVCVLAIYAGARALRLVPAVRAVVG